MAIFDFLKKKTDERPFLIGLIKDNAENIQQKEGKNHKDAEYLAICVIIDDLMRLTLNFVNTHSGDVRE